MFYGETRFRKAGRKQSKKQIPLAQLGTSQCDGFSQTQVEEQFLPNSFWDFWKSRNFSARNEFTERTGSQWIKARELLKALGNSQSKWSSVNSDWSHFRTICEFHARKYFSFRHSGPKQRNNSLTMRPPARLPPKNKSANDFSEWTRSARICSLNAHVKILNYMFCYHMSLSCKCLMSPLSEFELNLL